jgi:hypothetical protein
MGGGGGRWSGLPPPHLYTVKNVDFNSFRSQIYIKSALQCKYLSLKLCIGSIDNSVLAGEVSLNF